jgi:plastocyanin
MSMLLRRSLALIGVLMLAACYSSPSSPTTSIPTGPDTVLLPAGTFLSNGTQTFTPASLTVAAGTTVTFGNNDNYQHTTTSDTNLWNATLNPAGTFTFQFNTPGTYTYHCSLHPAEKGTIIVQ